MMQFILGFIFGSISALLIYVLILATKFNEREVNKNDKGN